MTVAPIEPLAAVGVAVDGDEHLRLDLGEAVDQAPRPEVRRAAGPDRPEARAGEQRDDRLGDIRDDGHDPVAATDPEPPEAGRRRPRPTFAAPPTVTSRSGCRSDWKRSAGRSAVDSPEQRPPRS